MASAAAPQLHENLLHAYHDASPQKDNGRQEGLGSHFATENRGRELEDNVADEEDQGHERLWMCILVSHLSDWELGEKARRT